MSDLTEDQRRDLLEHYMSTEPEIYVHRHPYLVSVNYIADPNYVSFYAVSMRTHWCGAKTLVPRDQWEQMNNGLCMAYLLNNVLDSLEEGIKRSGGKIDAAK
jgi:hypothetical protein